jgi:hypothetical protein
MGLLDGFKKIVGVQDIQQQLTQDNNKILQQYLDKVKEINGLEDKYEKMTNEQLRWIHIDRLFFFAYCVFLIITCYSRATTDNFRVKIKSLMSKGGGVASKSMLDSLLVESFAVVREASWRVLKMRYAYILDDVCLLYTFINLHHTHNIMVSLLYHHDTTIQLLTLLSAYL